MLSHANEDRNQEYLVNLALVAKCVDFNHTTQVILLAPHPGNCSGIIGKMYHQIDVDEKVKQLRRSNRCLKLALGFFVIVCVVMIVLFVVETNNEHSGSCSSNSNSNQSNNSSTNTNNSTASRIPNYFWGVTYATSVSSESTNSIKELENFGTYGYSNYEYNQTMLENVRFKIGSNTKLFVAVAIYQLQEKGLCVISFQL